MGFPKKTYEKLAVVMCFQFVARKSVAPSSGDFRRRPASRYACGQDQEFEEKSFRKIIFTPLPWPRPDFRERVTSMIFQGLRVFLLGGGVPILKSHSDFFVFNFFINHFCDL